MSDTAARIQALKDAAPAGPAATAKTTPPPDPARLLPLLVDLVGEQKRATETLQKAVSDYRFVNRCPSGEFF